MKKLKYMQCRHDYCLIHSSKQLIWNAHQSLRVWQFAIVLICSIHPHAIVSLGGERYKHACAVLLYCEPVHLLRPQCIDCLILHRWILRCFEAKYPCMLLTPQLGNDCAISAVMSSRAVSSTSANVLTVLVQHPKVSAIFFRGKACSMRYTNCSSGIHTRGLPLTINWFMLLFHENRSLAFFG